MPTSLTDELTKLGEMRDQGRLSEEEFAEAKRRLLFQAEKEPYFAADRKAEIAIDVPAPDVFRSSRWSSGNLFFPDALELSSDGLLFRKGAMFSSSKEFINYKSIASLRVKNGLFLSTLSIETSGGSQPIYINGLWKNDAQTIQDLIRSYQANT